METKFQNTKKSRSQYHSARDGKTRLHLFRHCLQHVSVPALLPRSAAMLTFFVHRPLSGPMTTVSIHEGSPHDRRLCRVVLAGLALPHGKSRGPRTPSMCLIPPSPVFPSVSNVKTKFSVCTFIREEPPTHLYLNPAGAPAQMWVAYH